MDQATAEVLEQAQAANPHYFKAIVKAMSVMMDRRRKYSGNFHPYYNFVDVAKRTGQTAWQVLKLYLGMKQSRFAVSGDTDYGDESVVDTLIDMINYAALALGWLLDKLTEKDVIPDEENQWEKIWPVMCLDFDGLMNQYKGWTGKYEMYEAQAGIEEALIQLKVLGLTLIVCTARPDNGLWEVEEWIQQQGLADYIYEVTNRKPPAVMYPDDRGWKFNGDLKELVEVAKTYKPYWEK